MVITLLALADLAAAAPDVWRLGSAAAPSADELLSASGRGRTLARLGELTSAAQRVERRVQRSPLLAVPGVRDRARSAAAEVVAATRAAEDAARAGDALVRGSGTVTPAALDALAGRLDVAGARAAAVPGGARTAGVAAELHDAASDVRTVAAMLGGRAPRRYLVALQNNAEMRDQGMVLSYAEVTLDDGRPVLGGHGSVIDLKLDQPAPIAVPAGAAAAFGPIGLNQLWESVNATADFPWSARAMAAMYEQATGRSVDGVWALDVPALARLLHATGPVAVDGLRRPLSAASAESILLHDIYQGVAPGQDGDRRRVLAGAMQAVMARVTVDAVDRSALATALVRGVVGGHVRAWSNRTDEQAALGRWGAAGVVAATAADRDGTFHVAVENRTATKLDYYVDVNARARLHMTAHRTALITTTVEIVNRAPIGAAPSYQLGPDGYGGVSSPGDYIGWVLLWGPGSASQPGSVDDAGLRLSQQTVVVPAGQRRRVTFETAIPDVPPGNLVLRFAPQARLRAGELRVSGPGAHWRGPWNRNVRVVFAAPDTHTGPVSMRWFLTLTAVLLLAVLAPATPTRAQQQYPPYPPTPTNPDGTPGPTAPGGGPVLTAPNGQPVPTTPDGRPAPTTPDGKLVTTTTRPVQIPGDSFVREVCTYKAGSQVTVALNGVTAVTVNADPSGCLAPEIKITSCKPPVVTIGGAQFAARLGSNTIAYSGTSATGEPANQASQINIACKRPAKERDIVPILLVGGGVVALLGLGVLAEMRNRRRLRAA